MALINRPIDRIWLDVQLLELLIQFSFVSVHILLNSSFKYFEVWCCYKQF